MFLKILISYILGYVKIKVEGYYIERFINICNTKKIFLWDVKRDKSIIMYARVRINEFKQLKHIAKTTQCKIEIEEKKGMPFFLNKYKKRKIFAICLISVVLMLTITSNYVWNIEIISDGTIDENEIITMLEQEGLGIGKLKGKIDVKKVINNIRLNRNDIAWMGINIEGTNAIVEIVKSTEKPEIVAEDEYCNIVSNKEGIITKINAQNGTKVANVGDLVRVGSPLVAGWLEGKYTGVRYVHARADIEAKVWYTKKEKTYYNQVISVPTGNKENKYSLNFNNFKINFYKNLSNFENYDTINESKKVKLFSNFYLPIEWKKSTNYEYQQKEVTYTEEELVNMVVPKLEAELKKEIKDTNNIVNKQVNTYKNEGYIEVEVIYEVIEKIGTEEKIIF